MFLEILNSEFLVFWITPGSQSLQACDVGSCISEPAYGHHQIHAGLVSVFSSHLHLLPLGLLG